MSHLRIAGELAHRRTDTYTEKLKHDLRQFHSVHLADKMTTDLSVQTCLRTATLGIHVR